MALVKTSKIAAGGKPALVAAPPTTPELAAALGSLELDSSARRSSP
jgi:hypothetical protein